MSESGILKKDLEKLEDLLQGQSLDDKPKDKKPRGRPKKVSIGQAETPESLSAANSIHNSPMRPVTPIPHANEEGKVPPAPKKVMLPPQPVHVWADAPTQAQISYETSKSIGAARAKQTQSKVSEALRKSVERDAKGLVVGPEKAQYYARTLNLYRDTYAQRFPGYPWKHEYLASDDPIKLAGWLKEVQMLINVGNVPVYLKQILLAFAGLAEASGERWGYTHLSGLQDNMTTLVSSGGLDEEIEQIGVEYRDWFATGPVTRLLLKSGTLAHQTIKLNQARLQNPQASNPSAMDEFLKQNADILNTTNIKK